ncbi:hypothetical protein, partial [Pseudoclavibacter sp. VKM Ac-2867]|uniref:hypothetical protein n=1 Tax=Pseudoclavibacter sp. VKM Ac-2867 TaxID=2783829 RepID=UPI0019FC20F7
MKKLYALISALIVALLFGGAVATAAHAAPIPVDPDVTGPELISAVVTSRSMVGAGDEVTVDFVVRESAGLQFVGFA